MDLIKAIILLSVTLGIGANIATAMKENFASKVDARVELIK